MRLKIAGYVFMALLIFQQCANPVAPTGGPTDEQPPKVVPEKSTPNLATNFADDEIILVFDEWVSLNDAFNQIIITPPLNVNPDIKLKKKGVHIKFKERLRDSTTYTIFFGDAVRDITQRNIADDLRFVFSTGPVIDSLEISGTVNNSTTGKPEPDMLVMLYENAYDSIVYKERPLYFAKTKKDGTFRIQNMRGGLFKLFALKDNNFNYLYDLDSELIGFQEEPVSVNDSLKVSLNIISFESVRPLNLKDTKNEQFGLYEIELNKEPLDWSVRVLNEGIRHFYIRDKAKTKLWYDSDTLLRMRVEVKGEGYLDTLQVRLPSRGNFVKTLKPFLPEGKKVSNGLPYQVADSIKARMRVDSFLPAYERGAIVPGKPFEIRFNRPIQAIDSTGIMLFKDSSRQALPVRATLSEDRQGLIINSRWAKGSRYVFFMEKGSVTGWYGQTLDSIVVRAKVKPQEDFGTLILKLTGLDSTVNYIVELVSPGKEEVARFRLNQVSKYQETFPLLAPGIYRLRFTEDTNRNGRWDSGSYEEKRQPEQILETSLAELRANWELESLVDLRSLKGK